MTDMTNGELTREVGRLERRFADTVSREVYERDMKEIRHSLSKIETTNTWMMRLVVTQLFGGFAAVLIWAITHGAP